tara:strand:+ start:258 stop:413 length:156 start_codon:yes stop_codon:yes gene_type:complete
VNKIDVIIDKLAELKNSVNSCGNSLTLEEYDWLHGDVEELQHLAYELKEEK